MNDTKTEAQTKKEAKKIREKMEREMKKKEAPKMGRPLKGKENRLLVSIRLEPSEKELLIKQFGGVQAAIDAVLESIKTLEKPRPVSGKRAAIKRINERMGEAPEWHKAAKKKIKELFPGKTISRSSAFPDELIVDFESTVINRDFLKASEFFEISSEYDYIAILKPRE